MKAPPGRWRRVVLCAARWTSPPLAYLLLCHLAARPAAVSPAGWRTTGIFVATMVGVMAQTLPQAVLVLLGSAAVVALGGVPVSKVLTGFTASPVVLVAAAMVIAKALRNSGLARRTALHFVRAAGSTPLGLAYALLASDLVLGGLIPSVTARSGGIILPIGTQLAELYDSRPGPTANRLGRFLMLAIYQGGTVTCTMHLGGQTGNLVLVGLAAGALGVSMTWAGWLVAALLPGLVSFLLVIYLTYRLAPPSVRRTDEAPRYASRELVAMGPMRRREATVLGVALGACALWATTNWHGISVVAVAGVAVAVLLVGRIIEVGEIVKDRWLWEMLVWCGGLFSLADALAASGSPAALARGVSGALSQVSPLAMFAVVMVTAYYAHYGFASITSQTLAMFLPLALALRSAGVPPELACYGLAFVFNLSAGLTHVGTTNGPMVFAKRYLSIGAWWRVGFCLSLINLVVWLTVGLAWWRLLRIW